VEIVANIWDRVLVVDDLVDLNIVDDYVNHLESLGEYTLAYIQKGKDKVYDAGTGVFQTPHETTKSQYTQIILNSGLVPVLPNHQIHHCTKVHKMNIGSLMAIHTDFGHSIAVTTYCTDCLGGELVVENTETGELAKVEPKRGRTVILKCDAPHSVLEVASGERITLQTFITYVKGDDDSAQKICNG
jgi:hypothetical protein